MKSVQEILEENNQTLYYQKDLSMIKNAWLRQVNEAKTTTYLDAYFIGMAKNAIALLNQVNFDLFLNHHCHKPPQFEEAVADHKARDFAELYRYQYLSFEELKVHLDVLSIHEKFYFYVRLIYPSFYFSHDENLMTWLELYRFQLSEITTYLSTQIQLPTLLW